jgi:hypothetical protein
MQRRSAPDAGRVGTASGARNCWRSHGQDSATDALAGPVVDPERWPDVLHRVLRVDAAPRIRLSLGGVRPAVQPLCLPTPRWFAASRRESRLRRPLRSALWRRSRHSFRWPLVHGVVRLPAGVRSRRISTTYGGSGPRSRRDCQRWRGKPRRWSRGGTRRAPTSGASGPHPGGRDSGTASRATAAARARGSSSAARAGQSAPASA